MSEDLSDERIIRAVRHPLRRRILGILDEEAASSKQLADRLGEALGTVSYHVGVLRDLGLLEVVEQRQRRGAVETHYRAETRATLSSNGWSGLSRSVRRSRWQSELQALTAALRTASQNGSLESDRSSIVQLTVQLDPPAREAARRCFEELWRRLDEIGAESRGRADSGVSVEAVVLATLQFSSGTSGP